MDEAGPLYDRSLAIREKALGPDHPDVATTLNNRAALLQDQVGAMTIRRTFLVVAGRFGSEVPDSGAERCCR